ncbi:hypothetical protein A33K_17826 [Burkholderia humptydooensis MSMB43]|uniref:Uncharacterized protein n=1 Tax=Burkholderia humptydooensis MSMB43 TaxID=441157 RepID=A0ABN0G0R9_9BURK|nr:hypothetical protein A33K_17826 [Burkholderia humptydooensis MSMB43]
MVTGRASDVQPDARRATTREALRRLLTIVARRSSVAIRSRRPDRDKASIARCKRLRSACHVWQRRRNVHVVHPAFPGSRGRTAFFRGDAQRRSRIPRRSRRRRGDDVEHRIRGRGVAPRSRARRARPCSGAIRFRGSDALAQAQLKRPRLLHAARIDDARCRATPARVEPWGSPCPVCMQNAQRSMRTLAHVGGNRDSSAPSASRPGPDADVFGDDPMRAQANRLSSFAARCRQPRIIHRHGAPSPAAPRHASRARPARMAHART